jgi:glycosyltransferase involved in cell wall biosynthesis
MTLLEAMACGTAVVAAANGAYGEVGADAALYFDPTDTAAVAESLVRISRDERLRADLAHRGRERATTLTWAATAAATLDVYRRLS